MMYVTGIYLSLVRIRFIFCILLTHIDTLYIYTVTNCTYIHYIHYIFVIYFNYTYVSYQLVINNIIGIYHGIINEVGSVAVSVGS